MRRLNLLLLGLAFLVYVVAFGRWGLRPVLFAFPFTMTPFVVNAFLARRWRAYWSQAVIFATTIAYAAWFIFVYVDVVILHPDPQSPIVFLFVSVYAIPVLLIMWFVGSMIEWETN